MTRFLDDFRLIGCWAPVAYWSRPHYKYRPISAFLFILQVESNRTTCQAVEREEKVWERGALSVTGRC
jgi:hypothetical protein